MASGQDPPEHGGQPRFHQTIGDLGDFVAQGGIDVDDCAAITSILLEFLNGCAIDLYHVA